MNSLHGEETLLHGITELHPDILKRKALEFAQLSTDPSLIEKHRQQYARLAIHYAFEGLQREAVKKVTDVQIDEKELNNA